MIFVISMVLMSLNASALSRRTVDLRTTSFYVSYSKVCPRKDWSASVSHVSYNMGLFKTRDHYLFSKYGIAKYDFGPKRNIMVEINDLLLIFSVIFCWLILK